MKIIQIEDLRPSSSQIIIKAIVVLGLITIVLLITFINPDRIDFLTCYFRELTGFPCPSCGLSHSLHAISHLNIQESINYHPLGLSVYFVLLLLLLKFPFELVFKTEIKINLSSQITKIMLFVFSFLWLSVWIIRLVIDL